MSQFHLLATGLAIGFAIGLAVAGWLQSREHKAWCAMFDRLFSIVERMGERLKRPDDEADWWKQN